MFSRSHALSCRSLKDMFRVRWMSNELMEAPDVKEKRLQDEEVDRDRGDVESTFGLLRPGDMPEVNPFRRLVAFTDWRFKTKEETEDYLHQRRVVQQKYAEKYHGHLGFDITAAYFIVQMGGKIRFDGIDDWISEKENIKPMPTEFHYGLYLTEVDASQTDVLYEGFENILRLRRLRRLKLRDCPYVDDWCMDRICGEFGHSLQHLDISGCRRISTRGVQSIAQLRSLRWLTLERMDHILELPYLCLLLLDVMPHLQIRGVDYLRSPPPLLKDLQQLTPPAQLPATAAHPPEQPSEKPEQPVAATV